MKNKKLTYILLPAVIGIWGMIFYRIYSGMDGNDKPVAATGNMSAANSNAAAEDTFTLIASYRDPFLGSMAVVNDHPKVSQPAANTPKPVEPKQVVAAPWPSVTYSGMIKNQKSSVQLAMLQVNGQGYTVKTGESIEGVQLLKIYRDSAEVMFQHQKKIIKK